MSTQTPKQAAALAKMHAMNAALTPEERKARSVRAAAASAAATKARAATPPAAPSTVTVAPQPATPESKPAPANNRMWTVTLVIKHEGGRGLWRCDVAAPTMRKAARQARRLFVGEGAVEQTAACVDKHAIALPNLNA